MFNIFFLLLGFFIASDVFAQEVDCNLSFKYSDPPKTIDSERSSQSLLTKIPGGAYITKALTVEPDSEEMQIPDTDCKIGVKRSATAERPSRIKFDPQNKKRYEVSNIEVIWKSFEKTPRTKISFSWSVSGYGFPVSSDSHIEYIICPGLYKNMAQLNTALSNFIKLDCPEVDVIQGAIDDKAVESDVGLSGKGATGKIKKGRSTAPSAKEAM